MSTNLQFTASLTAILGAIWFFLWMVCYKNRNREIEFNVRELAREREMQRFAITVNEEERRLMRMHHLAAVDQAMADLEDALDNWEPPRKKERIKVNWQKEGF